MKVSQTMIIPLLSFIIVSFAVYSSAGQVDFHLLWERASSNKVDGIDVLEQTNGACVVQIANTTVTNLNWLEQLNVTSLTLICPGLRDIDVVKTLPLERLRLAGCTQVKDLSPLTHLNLKSLVLEDMKALEPLALRIDTLEELNLAGSDVPDLSVLAGMKLKNLNISRTTCTNIAFVRGMPLEACHLAGSRVQRADGLEQSKLAVIDMSGCSDLTDISALKGLPIRGLSVALTSVTNIDVVASLSNLTSLSLGSCDIRDWSPLRHSSVAYLNIDGTKRPDFAVVGSLPHLHTLSARYVTGATYSNLSESGMRCLDLSGSDIQDVSFMIGMPQLESVDVRGTKVNKRPVGLRTQIFIGPLLTTEGGK